MPVTVKPPTFVQVTHSSIPEEKEHWVNVNEISHIEITYNGDSGEMDTIVLIMTNNTKIDIPFADVEFAYEQLHKLGIIEDLDIVIESEN